MPVKFDVAKRDVRLCGLLVEADEVSGKALQALRIAERCE
jgi:calcineurin-like phosphoesterase